jgi:hypothetical protein
VVGLKICLSRLMASIKSSSEEQLVVGIIAECLGVKWLVRSKHLYRASSSSRRFPRHQLSSSDQIAVINSPCGNSGIRRSSVSVGSIRVCFVSLAGRHMQRGFSVPCWPDPAVTSLSRMSQGGSLSATLEFCNNRVGRFAVRWLTSD